MATLGHLNKLLMPRELAETDEVYVFRRGRVPLRYPTLDLSFSTSAAFESAVGFIAANGTAARTGLGMKYDSTLSAWRYGDHNLALQSEAYNVTWTMTDTTPSQDATTHPLGASVWLLTEGSAGTSAVHQSVTVGTGQNLVHARDIKRGNHDWVLISIVDPAAPTTNFVNKWLNTATGAEGAAVTVGGTGAAGTNISTTAVGGGWYRLAVSGALGTKTSYRIRTFSADADGSTTRVNGATRYETRAQASVGTLLLNYKKTTSAGYYHPRFHTDPVTGLSGFLGEPQATNSIRNSTMQGAVAGTPGTLPTNWTYGVLGTLSTSVVGTGTENGIAYIDVRINGTSSTTNARLRIEATNQIAASSGQTWTNSLYVRSTAGATTNITSMTLDTFGRDAGDTTETETFNSGDIKGSLGATSIANNRITVAATLANASTAKVVPRLTLNFSSGVAIDITLRIGLPQLERDVLTSPSETFGAAVTRAADAPAITALASTGFNNTQGMVVFTGASNMPASNTGTYAWALSTDGNNIMYSDVASSNRRFAVIDGGVAQAAIVAGAQPAAGVSFTIASAYKANDFAASLNSAASVTDTSGTVPTISVKMDIMQTGGAGHFNGIAQKLVIYPRHPGAAQVPRYSV